MRKDIMEAINIMKKNEAKPNYAELARIYNCDYRVIKRYFENEIKERAKVVRPSLLDDYKNIINDKVDLGYSAKSIYYLLTKKGFKGKYGIVKKYCREHINEEIKKATIRFETNPGLQAQVDWKESMVLMNSVGISYVINIFLIILGYSRKKYIKLTLDRTQETLFQAITDSFKYFGGVPQEILFDNMKTVVDHAKSEYAHPVINQKMYEFSKDMGFEIKLCRAYRPQTKGRVENLAKIMDRLKVFNNEFDTLDDLDEIVMELNEDLNNEICQSTNETPNNRFTKEKEHLNLLPSKDIIDRYFNKPIIRRVTKESMITYNKLKYSLETKYIGKEVELKIISDTLYIYYNKKIIKEHKIIEGKKYNYDKKDIIEILKSDAFKYKDDDEVNHIAENMLKIYDKAGDL